MHFTTVPLVTFVAFVYAVWQKEEIANWVNDVNDPNSITTDTFLIQHSSKGHTHDLCDPYWRPAFDKVPHDRPDKPINTYWDHMLRMALAGIGRLESNPEEDKSWINDPESRNLLKAFFGVDIQEPQSRDGQFLPKAIVPAASLAANRLQITRGMNVRVLQSFFPAPGQASARADSKPRLLCGSNWLELRDPESVVDEDVAGAQSGLRVSLKEYAVDRILVSPERFDDFWWFLATLDGCKVYVRLSKHQFPPEGPSDIAPFEQNPDRNNDFDPCDQNPSGAFTICIGSSSIITLCPDTFGRFSGDRSDLPLQEIRADETLHPGSSPANVPGDHQVITEAGP